MDPLENPFSPGAGSPPPELVGRDAILEQAQIALHRLRAGRPAKSMILVGLRVVGKTVLLNRIRLIAEADGYRALFVEAHESKPLPALLMPHLRQVLFSLDAMENVSEKVKRGFRVLRSFMTGLKAKAKVGEVELELGVNPETGTADSGDLEAELAELFVAVAEAADDREKAVAICIDELQYLSEAELSALIMALHRVAQRALPLVMVGAGLPQIIALAGRSAKGVSFVGVNMRTRAAQSGRVAGSTNAVSVKLSSLAIFCIVSASNSDASGNTANELPDKGSVVKTFTTA